MVYLTTGFSTLQQSLASQAASRVHNGLTASTKQSHCSKFRLFLAFCTFVNISIECLDAATFLAFLEFLVQNNKSYFSITSTIAAVKTKLSMFGISTSCMEDKRISYFLKSIKINRPLVPKIKPVIDIPLLQKIVHLCDSTYQGFVYKAAYLTAFFSFLRISNLVPHSIASYTHQKQLARADIIFSASGAHIIVKWSKTMQSKDKVKILKIPSIPGSTLCPVQALQRLLKSSPGSANSPLFQNIFNSKWIPLTDSKLFFFSLLSFCIHRK